MNPAPPGCHGRHRRFPVGVTGGGDWTPRVGKKGLPFGSAFQTREGRAGRELAFRRRDGTLVWGSVSISTVRGPRCGTEFAVAMIEDVTGAPALRRGTAPGEREVEIVLNTMTRHDTRNCAYVRDQYFRMDPNEDPARFYA